VRREKALVLSGREIPPGSWFVHPVAIEGSSGRATIAAHTKLDDEQQQILYQLQLPLPERLEPIQILKCSENSAIA